MLQQKLLKQVQGWQSHTPAALVALAFFLLAAIYSTVTPIFESPDELWHYPFVWHVAQTGKLPIQDPDQPQLWAHEGSQAPLYYLLAGLLTAPIPADNLNSLLHPNPHADIGLVSPDKNVNVVIHTDQENWPWRGAVLAIHLARLFSALLGTGTVLSVYALGLTLWPERRRFALLAMAFVAFNPMFIFISGSVNNDNMITLVASLALWQLARLLVSTPPEPSIRQFIILGILAGLAALSKLSGLGIAGLIGLVLLGRGIRRRSWRTAILGNSLVGGLTLAIAGWWYWRNIILYGDWSGIETTLSLMAPRPFPPTPAQWLVEAAGLLCSFWGVFGYFSILMPEPVYWLLYLLQIIGAIGLLAAVLFPGRAEKLPPRWRQVWPVLVLWVVILTIGLIRYTLLIPSSQGRLLFPAMAALALLWAAGWTCLVPKRWHIVPALIMAPIAIWAPWGVIGPAYARPAALTTLPTSIQPLQVTFGDAVTLLGYEVNLSTVSPGEELPVTLYWRSEQPVAANYSLFVHLVNEYDLIITQRDVFHGPGAYPTSQWPAGREFADIYMLRLPGTVFAPAQAHFQVGLYDWTTGARLRTATGEDRISFGDIQIRPRPGHFPNTQTLFFEDGITLAGYTVDRRQVAGGDTLTLTLYWQARKTPSQNYKVFSHLVGHHGIRAAQHDGEPQSGLAPTGGWQPGQVVIDSRPLTIAPDAPPGAYWITVGLYHDDTGQRLQLVPSGQTPIQQDWVNLNRIRVGPVQPAR